MTRNQKIALGCGGAGCLGLIVVVIAGGLIWYFAYRPLATRSDEVANMERELEGLVNRNSNANENSSSTSSGTTTADSLSEDEKHKLFFAANATGDVELIRRVNVKLGLMDEDFTPGEKYEEFTNDHVLWAGRNYQWVLTVNTPEKARAYVNEHLP